MRTIDLNCDLAESAEVPARQRDAALMGVITSANVACGFHGGNPGLMRHTVRLAGRAGVGLGAHPGLPDAEGFGRVETQVSPADVEDLLLYQLGALAAIAAREGVPVRHVKPHGALYNMAARNPVLAESVAAAIKAFDPALILYALAGSESHRAAEAIGLAAAAEGFADRAYNRDGSLVPRSQPGAVLDDVDVIVRRAIRMVVEGRVQAADGTEIPLHADTLCIHSDTPGALHLAQSVRTGLEQAGVTVRQVFTGTE